MKKNLFAIFVLIFCSTIVYSQQSNNQPSYYQKSKSDSRMINMTNVLKTDVISIIGGELPILWGYRFLQKFEAEVGLGVLLPYYVNTRWTFTTAFDDENYEKFSNDELGYSASLALRVFPFSRPSDNYYTNFFVHYRHYPNVGVWDYGIGGGYQWAILNKFIIDFGTNFFFMSQNSSDNKTFLYNPESSMAMGISFSLKLGFILN